MCSVLYLSQFIGMSRLHFFCHGLASVHLSLALVCRWLAPRRLFGYRLRQPVLGAQHFSVAPGRLLLPSDVRGGLLREILHAADIGKRCEGLGSSLVVLGQPCSAVSELF